MNVEAFQEAVSKFGHTPSLTKTGREDWTRVFILDPQGVTVGRGSFYNDKLENLKQYRPSLFSGLIDSDCFFLRFELYTKTGKFITEAEYEALISKAKEIRRADLLAKQQQRDLLPKKKRPKLQGRGLLSIMWELLQLH